jgi:hypothetical protein
MPLPSRMSCRRGLSDEKARRRLGGEQEMVERCLGAHLCHAVRQACRAWRAEKVALQLEKLDSSSRSSPARLSAGCRRRTLRRRWLFFFSLLVAVLYHQHLAVTLLRHRP